jgi:hypothetical protein
MADGLPGAALGERANPLDALTAPSPVQPLPGPALGSRSVPELTVPTPETLNFIERAKREGISAKPPTMSVDEFRQLMKQPRIYDRYAAPAVESLLPAAGYVAAKASRIPGAQPIGASLAYGAARGIGHAARQIEDALEYDTPLFAPMTGFGSPARGEAAVKSVFDMSAEIAKGTKEDAMWQGIFAAPGFATGLGLRAFRRATGLSKDDIRNSLALSKFTGVNLGAIDIMSGVYESMARVAGILPIVGGKMRRSAEIKTRQIHERYLSFLDMIAPPVDVLNLAKRMTNRSIGGLLRRRNSTNALYEDMFDHFDKLGNPAVIPTQKLREKVIEILQNVRGENLPTGPGGETIGMPSGLDPGFEKALRQFIELGDTITPTQLRALQENLNKAGNTASKKVDAANEFRILSEMGAALRSSLDDIPDFVSRGQTPLDLRGIKSTITAANRSHGATQDLINTATANKFARVDRNFWGGGYVKPGSLEADELATAFVSGGKALKSVDFIDNLENLIGVSNKNRLARLVLEKAANPQVAMSRIRRGRGTKQEPSMERGPATPVKFEKAPDTEIVTFNADEMREKLGLSLVEGQSTPAARKALARLLRDTGHSIFALEMFLTAASKVQRTAVANPSVFLQRKVMFGGMPGGGAATAGSVGEKAALVTIGGVIWGARAFFDVISSPKGMRILATGLKPNMSRQQIYNFVSRINRALPEIDLVPVDQAEAPQE